MSGEQRWKANTCNIKRVITDGLSDKQQWKASTHDRKSFITTSNLALQAACDKLRARR